MFAYPQMLKKHLRSAILNPAPLTCCRVCLFRATKRKRYPGYDLRAAALRGLDQKFAALYSLLKATMQNTSLPRQTIPKQFLSAEGLNRKEKPIEQWFFVTYSD